MKLEDKMKKYKTVKGPRCRCGNLWYFAKENQTECTTCGKETPYPKPEVKEEETSFVDDVLVPAASIIGEVLVEAAVEGIFGGDSSSDSSDSGSFEGGGGSSGGGGSEGEW